LVSLHLTGGMSSELAIAPHDDASAGPLLIRSQ
jgi:hypothetical protein